MMEFDSNDNVLAGRISISESKASRVAQDTTVLNTI